MSYYPPMQNPFMMPFQQTPPQQNVPSINSVNSKASVENFFLPPNGSGLFLDETNKKVYKKKVDASGSAIIESLSYTVDEEEKPKEYVTKEELKDALDKFRASMKGVKNEPNTNSNAK